MDTNFNTNIITKKTTPHIVLEDFYKAETWDISKHPQFITLNEKQKEFIISRKHTVDFSDLKSKNLSNELKYYCQFYIENKGRLITTFSPEMGAIELTIRFLNEKAKNINSIADINIDKINIMYDQFLVSNGYSIHTSANNSISEDMEYVRFTFPTIYKRFFLRFTKFINEQYSPTVNNSNFFINDKWDIRDLPFKIDGFDPSRPRYIISFEKISQEKIKHLAKKFTLERLKSKKYSTCVDSIKGINILSRFLSDNYPEVNSLEELDRLIMEGFLGYINLDEQLKPRTKSSRIGAVKTFMETCTLYRWDGSPHQTLLLREDVKKKSKIMPKFYEDNILAQINENLEYLPIQVARMVFVLQNVGMRISELCSLKYNCLKQDTEKDYLLEYFQEKTKEWNRVPIKEDVAIAIGEAIKQSQDEFGDKIEYVFMQNEISPISKDSFSYHLNQLSMTRNIRDKNGKLVRIKAHHFRGTIATKYANLGMSSNIIRILLGQRSVGAIKYYIEILEETMTDSMQSLLSYQDQMISNMGNDTLVVSVIAEDNTEIPLPNGKCAKPLSTGKCTHANACYVCAMFKPDSKNIDLFKLQLSKARGNIEMAKINGFKRVLQINEDLVTSLEAIILKIEKGNV